MAGRFEDKVAIVTGGASGIGAATVRRLVADGAAVVIGDIDADGAAQVAAELVDHGGRVSVCRTDVSDESMVEALIGDALERYGRLDIMHNNAAAVGADVHGQDVQVTEGTVAVWDRTLAVDLRGVMLGCKYAIPAMLRTGGGVLVNMSSSAALGVGPAAVAYAAAKSGVISVTQHVAARYGRLGIRAVAIAPGLMLTPELETSMDERWRTALVRQQCTDRLGRPEDVANLVSFLASDEAAFITGVVVPIDGGTHCHRGSLADELELLGVTFPPA
jgi:NAD(P)-dependent dehydrogenase (short-subunit alcohol dehydrogenase family)